jgi:uncharacterized membrane protein YeiH
LVESFVHWLELCGVGVFAASGALTASRKQMDIVGFCLIATVTAIGGGTIRDLLLNRGPVFWVNDPSIIVLCFTVAAVVFFTAHHFESRFQALVWADAVGLALFCVGGAEISLSAGAPALVAVLMGVMTATFGSILRDVLCAEYPLLLRPEIYATAAALGAITYVALETAEAGRIAQIVGFGVAFGARAIGIVTGFSLPTYRSRPGRDYPPRV